MPVVDFHFNPELSYPQVAPASGPWPVYARQTVPKKEEMVSPLANSMKFQYPVHGQNLAVLQQQQQQLQYLAVPYMGQNTVPGMQVPRTTENGKFFDHPNKDSVSLASSRGSITGLVSSEVSSKTSISGSPGRAQKASKTGLTTHTDLAENTCEVCGKVFQKAYNLKSHMKTHSSERPFKCLFCPKTFARSHDRKRHENLHGGQKNFRCEGVLRDGVTKWGCGKKFARSDALARHFRTETGYLCVKQFMDEEKDREKADEHRIDLLYSHHHVYPAQPFYHQQPLSQQHQPQHFQGNAGVHPYLQMPYMAPQILLPPLLRH